MFELESGKDWSGSRCERSQQWDSIERQKTRLPHIRQVCARACGQSGVRTGGVNRRRARRWIGGVDKRRGGVGGCAREAAGAPLGLPVGGGALHL